MYTSYFAKMISLPEDYVPVSICGKAPEWYKGKQYKKVAPKYGFFMEWKRTHDNDYYVRCFEEQVLSQLNPQEVYKEICDLAGTDKVVLLCYERPEDFCHRHLVSKWLRDNGFDITEWGQTCR